MGIVVPAVIAAVIHGLVSFFLVCAMLHLWLRRREFHVRSRFVGLLMFQGCGQLIGASGVFIMEVVLATHGSYPCTLLDVTTYGYLCIFLPSLYFRTILLLAAYEGAKQGSILFKVYCWIRKRPYTTFFVFFISFVVTFAVLLLIQVYVLLPSYYSGTQPMCYLYRIWQLWVVMIFGMMLVAVLLARRLIPVNDIFKMGEELLHVVYITAVWLIVYFVFLLTTLTAPGAEETMIDNFHISIIHFIWFAATIYITFVKPLRRVKYVVYDKKNAVTLGIHDVLGNHELRQIFKKHAQRCLCRENVDFLEAVEAYETNIASDKRQMEKKRKEDGKSDEEYLRDWFAHFQNIYELYIQDYALYQINIYAAESSQLRPYANWNDFKELSFEKQKNIFATVVLTVQRLLQQNILNSFVQSEQFRCFSRNECNNQSTYTLTDLEEAGAAMRYV